MPTKPKKRPAADAFVAVNFRLARADDAALQAEIAAIGDSRSTATHLRGIVRAHLASRAAAKREAKAAEKAAEKWDV